MKRFHKQIYFPNIDKLKKLNAKLNCKNWQYSKHCLENIQYREINIKRVLQFISELELNFNDIFEYYTLNNDIIKVCYRISYDKNADIILVLNQDKKIITIYYNNAEDKHFTLKESLYCKG